MKVRWYDAVTYRFKRDIKCRLSTCDDLGESKGPQSRLLENFIQTHFPTILPSAIWILKMTNDLLHSRLSINFNLSLIVCILEGLNLDSDTLVCDYRFKRRVCFQSQTNSQVFLEEPNLIRVLFDQVYLSSLETDVQANLHKQPLAFLERYRILLFIFLGFLHDSVNPGYHTIQIRFVDLNLI